MKKISLGVSSSISIYKSCNIIRNIQKSGYSVQVIMTKNATKLICPLLFSAVSKNNVMVDLFTGKEEKKISHIDLAKETSLFVVAPATANIIGKFANGIADDFLSTFYMAVRSPVLIAPAMNEKMYFHQQTQLNIRKLESLGVYFIKPEKGYLACKEEGWGRLADSETIVKEAIKLIEKGKELKGKRILVTAGPTREYMDSVRFLSNPSSGKMGYMLAQEAIERGAEVILVSGPTNIPPPPGVKVSFIETADELDKEISSRYDNMDIIIMAAAVSDFRFTKTEPRKIKKQNFPGEIKIIPNKDILAELGKKKGKKIVVGFAAETEHILENAKKKSIEKNLDFIVANDISKKGTGFSSDDNDVFIVTPDGESNETGKKSKIEISRIIMDRIGKLIGR
ncbi:MAG: bifunctional phosphopantothenoylcysteine decarboxylase/phosphopantothenate--cysteine ligase CoaBC [Candidatus Aminicenantaceae bacterium]